jgi:iron complex transport system ATP-binding protein
MPHDDASPVIEIDGVSVIHGTRATVDNVSITVQPHDRWAILGPNGCGKTTLLRVMSLYLHPSKGVVRIDGQALSTFDIRPVRPRLAYVSASLAAELRPALTALEIVMSAKNGALEVWWHEYDDADQQKARECLMRMGVAQHADTPLGALSSGEQQRVLLSRALMTDPIAILLDEPSARLDLGGREQLVRILDEFSSDNQTLPSVVVTHHVDEIPASTTHCALMRDGVLIASGPLNETLTSENLTATFGMNLVVERRPNGRLGAYAP